MSSDNFDTHPDRIIDAKERRTLVPLSDVQIWRLEREDRFPRRVKVSANRVGWRYGEILDWLRSREVAPITVTGHPATTGNLGPKAA